MKEQFIRRLPWISYCTWIPRALCITHAGKFFSTTHRKRPVICDKNCNSETRPVTLPTKTSNQSIKTLKNGKLCASM
jgi:hypothetical protein